MSNQIVSLYHSGWRKAKQKKKKKGNLGPISGDESTITSKLYRNSLRCSYAEMLELLYQTRLMISPSPASYFLCVSCNTKCFRGSGTFQQCIWFSGHAMQKEILSPELIISMHYEWELTVLVFYPTQKHNYLWIDWVLLVIQFPSEDAITSCSQAFRRLNIAQHRISCLELLSCCITNPCTFHYLTWSVYTGTSYTSCLSSF